MAEKYLVEGYEYDTLKEANIAKKEMQAVKYLSQKTEKSSPAEVYKIYNKIVEENLFKTEIGFDYLRALEEYLMQSGIFGVGEDTAFENDTYQGSTMQEMQQGDLPQTENTCQQDGEKDQTPVSGEALPADNVAKPAPDHVKKLKDKLIFSIALNVILAVAVMAMLYIASTSSNVNILNYETAILNEYSSWAEELKTKEADIKAREKEVSDAEKKVTSLNKQIKELEEEYNALVNAVDEAKAAGE